MRETKILEVKSAVKNFSGLVAVNDVSLHVDEGEILGLIGPNGAGKTTLFNGITGVDRYTSGEVFFKGQNISKLAAHDRCKLGIGRTFQITEPFERLTVLQNVSVGGLFGTAERARLFKKSEIERCEKEAEEILAFLGLGDKKDVLAGQLNIAERKRLELCRALATKPTLLLLDEVVAGLNPSEVSGMMENIRKINKSGISILMIEHVMKAVTGVCDRVVVISFGELITEGTPAYVMSHSDVIEAYLGRGR